MGDSDLLHWSDELQAFFLDEEMQAAVPDDYLFRTDTFDECFWKIAMEMEQLNDYCVLLLQETSSKLASLMSELRALEAGEKSVVVDERPWTGDFTGETIYVLSEKVDIWRDTYGFIARATCLLLLSAFTERSLKMLCDRFAPDRKRRPRRRPGESKVAMYLRFLQETCGVRFSEPRASHSLRNECRHLRNAFAHGDWDELKDRVGCVHLRDAFGAVACLLSGIESGADHLP